MAPQRKDVKRVTVVGVTSDGVVEESKTEAVTLDRKLLFVRQ